MVYVTIMGKGEVADREWRVEVDNQNYKITDLASGKTSAHTLKNFSYVHNSLMRLGLSQGDETLQFMGSQNDLRFDFYYHGGKVNTMIYDEVQYKYKKHMAPPSKVDYSKSIISPMPGAVVSVNVVVGQTVVDGQDLCVIEAMKMQNILKSERDGKIKSVKVVAGDSVAVD